MPTFKPNDSEQNLKSFASFLVTHHKAELEKENENPYTEDVDLDISKDLLDDLTENLNLDTHFDQLQEEASNWIWDSNQRSAQTFFDEHATISQIGKDPALMQALLDWAKAEGVELEPMKESLQLSSSVQRYVERTYGGIAPVVYEFYTNEDLLESFYEELEEDVKEAFLDELRDESLDYFNEVNVRLVGSGQVTQEIDFECHGLQEEIDPSEQEGIAAWVKSNPDRFLKDSGGSLTLNLPVLEKQSEWVDVLLHLKIEPASFFALLVPRVKELAAAAQGDLKETLEDWLIDHAPYTKPMEQWHQIRGADQILHHLLLEGCALEGKSCTEKDMEELWDFFEAMEIFDNTSCTLRLTLNMDDTSVEEVLAQKNYNGQTQMRGKADAYVTVQNALVEADEGSQYTLAEPIYVNLKSMTGASPNDYFEGTDPKVMGANVLKSLYKASIPAYEVRAALWKKEEKGFVSALEKMEQELLMECTQLSVELQKSAMKKALQSVQSLKEDTDLVQRLGSSLLDERLSLIQMRLESCFDRAGVGQIKNIQEVGARLTEQKRKEYVSSKDLASASRLQDYWCTDMYGAPRVLQLGSVVQQHIETAAREGKIDETDAFGRTSLMFAASQMDAKSVALLLEAGASVAHRDVLGNSVLDYFLKSKALSEHRSNLGEILEQDRFHKVLQEPLDASWSVKSESTKVLSHLMQQSIRQMGKEAALESFSKILPKSGCAHVYQVLCALGCSPVEEHQKYSDYKKNSKTSLSYLSESLFAHCQKLFLESTLTGQSTPSTQRARL